MNASLDVLSTQHAAGLISDRVHILYTGCAKIIKKNNSRRQKVYFSCYTPNYSWKRVDCYRNDSLDETREQTVRATALN